MEFLKKLFGFGESSKGEDSFWAKEREEQRERDIDTYGSDIALDVNIKDERTLILFLGSITGGLNNHQLGDVQNEYVSNMKEITSLANLCRSRLAQIEGSIEIIEYLDKVASLEGRFFQSIGNPNPSDHIGVLKKLVLYYQCCFRLKQFVNPQATDSYEKMLKKIKQQVMYVNNLSLHC